MHWIMFWGGGPARAWLALVGCALWGAPEAPAQSGQKNVAADTSVFAAVVREIQRGSEPVRVDPRPLVPEFAPTTPVADDLAQVPPEVVAARAAVLRRLGVQAADALEHARCAGSQGLPPPPPPPGRSRPRTPEAIRARERCLRADYVSAIVGVPRFCGAPPESAAHPNGPQECRTVRVFQSTLVGYEISEFVLVRNPPDGAWTVVDRRSLGGFVS